ncbi:60S acidic ribosomal protein P1 [Terramyces sp. JEL0728]|nr:60S acidic ribosomal protein P1 [Terramyces sp. JEL0728]
MSLSTAQSACVYAALILQDEGLEITADKLSAIISASGVEVESIWPAIFAKALAGKDLGALLFNVGAGGAPVAAAGGAAAPAAGGAAAPAEEEKAEEKEESDDDMGFGLFD